MASTWRNRFRIPAIYDRPQRPWRSPDPTGHPPGAGHPGRYAEAAKRSYPDFSAWLARHYPEKPASSGLLKVGWRSCGGEFAELA
jgi:hypothetical protein